MAAVVGAAAILGATAAATPLFSSSAGNAALARQVATRCPTEVGASVLAGGPLSPAGLELLRQRDAAVRRAVADVPGAGPPELSVVGPVLTLAADASRPPTDSARLVVRPGALDHVEVVGPGAPGGAEAAEPARGPGVWLPESAAMRHRVGAGGEIALGLGGRTATARVAGVYRDLSRQPPTPFWCSMQDLIYQPGTFAEFVPPPLLLADRETLDAVSSVLQEPALGFSGRCRSPTPAA